MSTWKAIYHQDADPRWWEVVETLPHMQEYFVVEHVGDPSDSERLAALLNHREKLLVENIDQRELLSECRQKLQLIGGDSYDELIARIDELLAR